MITKPMLAVSVEDLNDIMFPVLATPKLDGIRCLVVGGKALSRKFKPIPNRYIREQIEKNCPDGFDGEIMIPGADFNKVQSLVMSEDGEPQFEYHVFDYVEADLKAGYDERVRSLITWAKVHSPAKFLRLVLPTVISTTEELLAFEEKIIEKGYEGVMLRKVDGPYKCNRSTLKEGYLLKFKRFRDSEAEIIGFVERMKNNNVLETNELGYAKRSKLKENLIPAGTLGALKVRDIYSGVEFEIGTGMDDNMRKYVWENQSEFLGAIVTYQFQPTGMKDKPRFPSFKGVRHPDDIGVLA